MSYYLDTSALVAAIVREPYTPSIRQWLSENAGSGAFVSDWCHTEMASALSLKVRTGEIDLNQRALAQAAWQKLHTASLPTLAVLPEHFEVAGGFAGQPHLSLRAADALHLAIAEGGGHVLVTFD